MHAQGATVQGSSNTDRAWRSLLTEQLRIVLEQRPVRLGVVALLFAVASVFDVVQTPIGVDSGWMFIVPVAISAIAAGVGEGLVVACAAAILCAAFSGVSRNGFEATIALSVFSARFGLYGITAVVLGSFAEAHHMVQSRLRDLATLDPLTNVFNVATFYREIGILELQQTDFAVMLVDVDALKRINDTYGHQAGTQAIQSLARVLRRVVRGSDLIARYGGDEFVVILREANMAGAQIVINRMREMLEEEKLPGAPHHTLSVSVGVALFGEDGKSAEELLEAADRRMYRDKQTRKLARRPGDIDIWGISQSY
ncbi:MAG: GGDEF domain-containing protein [Actinomycetota bacterium]|nr:GGDEF domain-containing protein [Actinomycetota bacterium]